MFLYGFGLHEVIYFTMIFRSSEISLPRSKYKELIDKTIELEKLKALNIKLVDIVKDKSTQIKVLKRKLDDKNKNKGTNDCMV